MADGGFKRKGWSLNRQLGGEVQNGKVKLLEEIAEEKVLGVF